MNLSIWLSYIAAVSRTKLDSGKAWERGYYFRPLNLQLKSAVRCRCGQASSPWGRVYPPRAQCVRPKNHKILGPTPLGNAYYR